MNISNFPENKADARSYVDQYNGHTDGSKILHIIKNKMDRGVVQFAVTTANQEKERAINSFAASRERFCATIYDMLDSQGPEINDDLYPMLVDAALFAYAATLVGEEDIPDLATKFLGI